MRGTGRRRSRTATVTAALIAAATIACGAAYGTANDDPTEVPRARDDSGEADGSGGGGDAATGPDVGDRLPGTDGAADDGAPISLDASLDGASPPGCPGDAGCERVVFVTSTAIPYNLVAAADSQCNTSASGAALPRVKGRQFQAWISNTISDGPVDRFVKATGPYIRPNGTVIASSWSDLTDGVLQAAIFHDENGSAVSAGTHVWTATSLSGAFSGPNCGGWADSSAKSGFGVAGATTSSWTTFSGALDPCSASLRLYCFEK